MKQFKKMLTAVIPILLFVATLMGGIANAQVINEGFEEVEWVAGTTTGTPQPTSTISVNATGTASINNGKWSYSNAIVVGTGSAGTLSSIVRNGTKGFWVGVTGNSFIITPIIGAGITTVTFAAYPYGSSSAGIYVGVATNTAVTANTASMVASATNGTSGQWRGSGYASTLNSANGFSSSGSWVTISFTTNIPVGQDAYLKIQRQSGGQCFIDDIVVTGAAPVLPTVTTTAVTAITPTSASSGGNVTATGGATVTQRGIVYSTSIDPTTDDAKVIDGAGGTGSYVSSLTPLLSNTSYHVRAYAINSVGTAYGADIPFTTGVATTNYYNIAGSDATVAANWGTNTDGSGIQPADFVTNGQIFNVTNTGSTMGAAWTVSGTSSKVVIGNGSTPVSFTVPPAFALTATVDAKASATLIVQNTTSPTFGTLDAASTVAFDGSGSLSIPAANFGNLLSTNDGGATRTLANAGTIGIAGTFTIGSATYTTTGSTISFNGSSAQTVPAFSYAGLTVANALATTLGSSQIITVNGLLTVSNNFVVAATDTLVYTSTATIASTATRTITINGAFINETLSSAFNVGSGSMQVNGVYKITGGANGVQLTFTNVTFASNSIMYVSSTGGIVPRLPATNAGHVVWNCAAGGSFLQGNTAISGNFTINSTVAINNGTGGTGRALTVSGKLYILNGEYDVIAGASPTANQSLTVNDSIYIVNGILNSSTATTAGAFTGTITVNAVTGSVTVGPQGSLISGQFGNLVLNNRPVTVQSDATGTGIIGAMTGSITGATNVTVQRYIPAGNRAFRFLTPGVTTTGFIKANWQEGAATSTANPVAGFGTHITGNTTDQTNGFDGTTTGNPSLFLFDNSSQLWSGIGNTNATVLTAGNAYRILVRGNRAVDLAAPASPTATATTLRATGTLLTGSVIMNSTGVGATANMPLLSGTIGGYSFVGNPYASPVNWDNIHASAVGLEDYYYTWDPTRSTRGAYVYWDKSDALNGGSPGSAVNQHIQPGQAIFVRSSSATPVLTFNEVHKSSSFTNTFRTQSTLTGRLTIGLTNTALMANNNGFDGANILFADNFSAAIDGEDIPKITNQDENLSVYSSSTNLMKEARPTVTLNDTVQLRVWQLASNNYILTFDAQQFAGNKEAYLLDGYLNTVSPINIAGNTQYPFTTNANAASYNATRFQVVFKTSGALPVSITSLKAFQKNTSIQVEWNTANEINMSSYEVEKSADGTSFKKAGTVVATGSSTYNWFDASPVNGNNFYRIKMVDKNGTTQYTQIVNVKIGGIKNIFTIVGNPVKNKTVLLQMENVEKSSYTVAVFNNLGQQIVSRTINHAGGSSTETIALGNAATGTYQLSIIGTNVKETRTIIVE